MFYHLLVTLSPFSRLLLIFFTLFWSPFYHCLRLFPLPPRSRLNVSRREIFTDWLKREFFLSDRPDLKGQSQSVSQPSGQRQSSSGLIGRKEPRPRERQRRQHRRGVCQPLASCAHVSRWTLEWTARQIPVTPGLVTSFVRPRPRDGDGASEVRVAGGGGGGEEGVG